MRCTELLLDTADRAAAPRLVYVPAQNAAGRLRVVSDLANGAIATTYSADEPERLTRPTTRQSRAGRARGAGSGRQGSFAVMSVIW